jgi:hypothetical protein
MTVFGVALQPASGLLRLHCVFWLAIVHPSPPPPPWLLKCFSLIVELEVPIFAPWKLGLPGSRTSAATASKANAPLCPCARGTGWMPPHAQLSASSLARFHVACQCHSLPQRHLPRSLCLPLSHTRFSLCYIPLSLTHSLSQSLTVSLPLSHSLSQSLSLSHTRPHPQMVMILFFRLLEVKDWIVIRVPDPMSDECPRHG